MFVAYLVPTVMEVPGASLYHHSLELWSQQHQGQNLKVGLGSAQHHGHPLVSTAVTCPWLQCARACICTWGFAANTAFRLSPAGVGDANTPQNCLGIGYWDSFSLLRSPVATTVIVPSVLGCHKAILQAFLTCGPGEFWLGLWGWASHPVPSHPSRGLRHCCSCAALLLNLAPAISAKCNYSFLWYPE